MSEQKVWPETLCSEDQGRPKLERPIRLQGHIVCTDGKVLVRIADDGRDAVDPDNGPEFERVCEPLGHDGEGALTFDVATLREWCGPIEDESCPDCRGERDECRTCDGDGQLDCECATCGHTHGQDCGDCGGRGYKPCVTCGSSKRKCRYDLDRQGTYQGLHLNRRLLAHMLTGAWGGLVDISVSTSRVPVIVLRGNGWEGLLMPLAHWYKPTEGDDVQPLEPLATQPTEAR